MQQEEVDKYLSQQRRRSVHISLQDFIDYEFKNKDLLRRALTDRTAERQDNYERLEFKGGAILYMIVTDYLLDAIHKYTREELYERRHEILDRDRLCTLADERLKLDQFVRRPHYVEIEVARLAGFLEAIIAGIDEDGGRESAKAFVVKFIIKGKSNSMSMNCL